MKEYVYIPLGGNRVPKIKKYLNLLLVFFISGLWHGASWTFIAWGMFHGVFIVIDKAWWLKNSQRLPAFFNIGITFFLVLISWVLFRSDTISQTFTYLGSMFGVGVAKNLGVNMLWANVASNRASLMLFIGLIISFIPAFSLYTNFVAYLKQLRVGLLKLCVKAVCIALIFGLCVISLTNAAFNPFIYFRF